MACHRTKLGNEETLQAQEKLEAFLVEGIQSGEPTDMTRQDWFGIRAAALKQFEARKSRKSA